MVNHSISSITLLMTAGPILPKRLVTRIIAALFFLELIQMSYS